MQNITSTAELKNAIQLLKVEKALNEQLLKKQFQITRESLKPANLIKNSIKNTAVTPDLTDDIIGPAIVLATSYLAKKIIGDSDNKSRKLLGSILQFSVTNYVAQHPEKIKTISDYIFQHIFSAKKNLHFQEENK